MPIFELCWAIPVKSRVKIWFGLVEIGCIWIFKGGRTKPPIRGGYMWPAMPIFEPGRAIPVKSRVKIWFRLVEPFRSYRVHKHKHPKKKKNHRRNWKQYPWKNSLPADIKMTKSQAQLKTIAFRKILFWADKKKPHIRSREAYFSKATIEKQSHSWFFVMSVSSLPCL